MTKRILFVLTSNDDLGGVRKTGFYVPEAAHPWNEFSKRGYEIDFVSPKGGAAPMDGFKADDAEQVTFLEAFKTQLEQTKRPDQIEPKDYDAIFYVGGHGTMWDFPNATEIASLASSIYENGGVVSAVCHGPAGLLNIKLSNGKYLIEGKNVAGFSNEEEEAVKLTSVVPFLLEEQLIERGAKHSKAANFQPHVVVSDRLVTGQNPASARGVAQAMLQILEPQNSEVRA
jgi:putative intracellular protease/amidase